MGVFRFFLNKHSPRLPEATPFAFISLKLYHTGATVNPNHHKHFIQSFQKVLKQNTLDMPQ